MNGNFKTVVGLATRAVEALESIAGDLKWFRDEVERTGVIEASAKNAWNIWHNHYHE